MYQTEHLGLSPGSDPSPANADPGAGRGQSLWLTELGPFHQMGDLDGVPYPLLAIVKIYRVNQQMRAILLCPATFQRKG